MINYIIVALIMAMSLYVIIASTNLLKKVIALGLFQSAIILFFITMAKVYNGKPPVLDCLNFKECPQIYSNPLPHVLMLTAIVVGVAVLAVALALIIKINKIYGTIDIREINKND